MYDDLCHAVRALARTPSFSAVAVAMVAVGIGLNTAVFSIVNVMLFRPPPVERAEELVWISSASRRPDGPRGNMTLPDVEDLRALPVLAGAGAYAQIDANVATDDLAVRVGGQVVTGDFFQVLGVRPHGGRLIQSADDGPAADPVAVIGFGLWQRLFGGADTAIGRTLRVNGRTFVIAGVAPRGFTGADLFAPSDVWVPLSSAGAVAPGIRSPSGRTSWWLRAIGRLGPGVTLTDAAAALQSRAAAIAQAFPASHDGFTVRLDPVRGASPGDRGEVRPLAALLLAVTMTVLMIACANVANLLLARGVARGRDVAVRVALGASRLRIVRHQLAESGLLAACGGALGLVLSLWATELLLRLIDAPIEAEFTPDRRVLLFTMGVSAATAIVFGLAPALRSASAAPGPALKSEQGSSDARPRTRLQAFLVAGQVALSLVLLLAAGVFLQSLVNARHVDVGFDPTGRVSMSYNLRMHGYPDERAAAFHAALLDRVRSTANVRSATLATLVPLGGRVWVTDLTLPGRPRDPDARPERIGVNHVWPAFFDTMDIRIVKGRPLGQADMVSPVPLTAVVSETMARRFWPDGDPIGERFSVDGPEGPFVDGGGVARDVLTDEFTERPWPFVYLPGRRTGDDVALIAHVAGDAGAALRAIEAQLRTLDSSVAVFEPMTLGQHIARRLDGERALSRVLSLAGLLALGLAALGLYGLVAYTVARRTREIGIRVALGAQPADIVRLFVTDALRISLVGLVAGTPPAVGVTALLAGSLVGVGMIDVSTMSGAMLVLAVVTLAAAYLPARRATRVDAIVALRSE